MNSVLEDFEVNSYFLNHEIYLNNLYNKAGDKNFSSTEKLENYLLTVFIEELDKKDNILFTKKQIKSMYCDIKNGIFVFRGVINEKDTPQLKLIKNALKNRTFNQFIKNITITKAVMKDLKNVNILREFKFKGYIADFYEYYDNFGNFTFEFVLCRRKIIYRDDIYIKRTLEGFLVICIFEEVPKIVFPEPMKKKNKKKGLQADNAFWNTGSVGFGAMGLVSGGKQIIKFGAAAMGMSTVGVSGGAIITGAVVGTVVVILAGNAIWSGGYSLYLDYVGRDDEIELDTLKNNPVRFICENVVEGIFGKKYRNFGEVFYYLVEGALGIFAVNSGIRAIIKGFTKNKFFRVKKIRVIHSTLGSLEGAEKN